MRELDRAELLRRLGLGTGAASLVGLLGAAEAAAAPASDQGGNFPRHPRWRFHFLTYRTTDPLFVPLQYGIQDACALVGCTYRWAGSARGRVPELVSAFDAAIKQKADGIAVSIVDPTAFNDPVDRALGAGIPVVAFGADAPAGSGNRRLAFVGQDPYATGTRAGERFAKLVGRGEVALLAMTPAEAVLRRRIDGVVAAIRKSGAPISPVTVATGDSYSVETTIEDHVGSRKALRGLLALDPVSAEGLALVMKKRALHGKGLRAGGYGVLPATIKAIHEGNLDFAIDEQPYLQGFLPVLHLFLSKLSGGLLAPWNTETGLHFVTKANVGPYLKTKSRFEGNSSKHRYPPAG